MQNPVVERDDIVLTGAGYEAVILASHKAASRDGGLFNTAKLRYIVRTDNYAHQCHYRVELFNRELGRWNELWTLQPMRYTAPSRATERERQLTFVQERIDELHAKVTHIIGEVNAT